ncbi:MAG: hypothetical protein K2W78_03425 [Xanthobacteraceae bacterium]|nr:hypothetical protein [Xanthobacteraceae bacterium]
MEDRSKLSQDELFAQAHERSKKHIERIDNMILTVVKAQIVVEGFMSTFLEANGKDPQHFFYTALKIKECKKIDPPEVGQNMWDLLSLCTYVRNELVHSLKDEQITIKMDEVRRAYLAVTENERQRQAIREMTDTQMVTSAIYACGNLIVAATDRLETKEKARPSL